MNCLDSNIFWNKAFFNQHDSSLGRHVNAASRKSLETKRTLLCYYKTKNPFEKNICMKISFQLL